ncbi:MAG TPA: hypothetical protein VM912_13865 [Terriglobales bacterium]|nr:hypothetical protein [Terriglobales bacterium]
MGERSPGRGRDRPPPINTLARRRGRFCYFHEESRQGRKNKKRMQMPVLEDQRALQMAVTKICQDIIDETIEPKRASTLLYGLQVASTAVSKAAPAKSKR